MRRERLFVENCLLSKKLLKILRKQKKSLHKIFIMRKGLCCEKKLDMK